MQGGVTIRTRMIWSGASLAVALAASCCQPLTAQAGSLLSGYGGPGQGQQQILGSTLVGGPGGGSSGGSATAATGAGRGLAGPRVASPTQASGSALPGAGAVGRHVKSLASTPRGRSSVGRVFTTVATYPASERVADSGAGSGLSSSDILYVCLGAAVLAFTGVLTTRASHAKAAREGH
jgi:hypothetical protein